MDLEAVGKKMIEALVAQGYLSGLEEKQSSINVDITKIAAQIETAKSKEARNIESRKQAGVELTKAEGAVNSAEANIKAAEASLKRAVDEVERSKKEVTKYNEDVQAELEKNTSLLVEAKKQLEADRDSTFVELTTAKEEAEAKLAELNAQGISLDIGRSARQPRTTIL